MADKLISYNGLNQDLIEKAHIRIYDADEDLIQPDERDTGREAENPVTLVCEAAYRQGVVEYIEGLACAFDGEFRGYRAQLPGRKRQFVVLQGEEPGSFHGVEYVTVGFLDHDGDVLPFPRCILVKEVSEMARLGLFPGDVPDLDLEPEKQATARRSTSRNQKRRRVDSSSEPEESASATKNAAGARDEEADDDEFAPLSRKRPKRSSMNLNYAQLAGERPRQSHSNTPKSASQANRHNRHDSKTASADDSADEESEYRANQAKIKALNKEKIEKDKELEDLRKQVAEAKAKRAAKQRAELASAEKGIHDKDEAIRKERERLQRLLAAFD